MTVVPDDAIVIWVVAFIVIAPLIVIGAGELEGRLRFRDSAFVPTISILRVWVLPLTAIWLVGSAILGFNALLVRLVATAAVFAIGADLVAMAAVFVGLVRSRAASGARRNVPRLLLAIPKIIVVLFVSWVLLQVVWAVDLSAMFQALGVTTLIISVALQDTIGGIASGFLLMLDRPFQPGDWIKAEDVEGRVVDTNWRSSRIENRDHDLIIVPNGKLAGATIINFDQPARLHRVQVDLQVAFSNPPTLAKEMILDAAHSVSGVLEDPAPSVIVTQVDDPLMGYSVRMWIEDFAIDPRVKSDFRSLVWYMSHRHGVPLPSPAFDLYTYDGPETAAAGAPKASEIRSRLISSHLLDGMADEDVDHLTALSSLDRYAAGEIITDRLGSDSVLFTLWQGEASMEIHGPNDAIRVMTDLTPGDVFGLVYPPETEDFSLQVVAVSDCEVVRTDFETAGPVVAKDRALLDAIGQIRATRTRRMDRLVALMDSSVIDAGSSDAAERS
ncbi:MAG: mechanosensitive ion channel [Actinomycetia bacterium]|nr:mechanosensitive ion channel [Actinomycetes bacterium]